ncbi:protein POLR1D-like [Brachionichthys hirsutus]|uniref:protein POLR1D-like n=1 Tax=Brachionichthys hirsutus TaxID=412623 RepID=UPI0036046D89
MAEESDLEKRAVEELLKETDRARVRAETMGPAGWLKCPLQSTNKRFLLNTLRSPGFKRHFVEPSDRNSSSGGRLRRDSPDRSRDRSRTPPRKHRSNGGHSGHKHRHRDKDEKRDKDRERNYRHKNSSERRPGREVHNRDKDRLPE